MSYDISLCDPVTHETLEVDDTHFVAGGTRSIGGTKELWLNITYNYGNYAVVAVNVLFFLVGFAIIFSVYGYKC